MAFSFHVSSRTVMPLSRTPTAADDEDVRTNRFTLGSAYAALRALRAPATVMGITWSASLTKDMEAAEWANMSTPRVRVAVLALWLDCLTCFTLST